MISRRFALGLLGIATGVLVTAFPAAGKDGVEATLRTAISLDAPAGTHLHIAWKLAYSGGTPFSANGAYVRLLSASGGNAETGVASTGAYRTGEYAATVVVPDGGIGDVVIGLRGWTSGVTGTHRSDALFPITNDPVPGVISSRPAGSPTWIFVLAAGSLLTVAVVIVALQRRRKLLKPLLPRS
jgi:hypothetical protein